MKFQGGDNASTLTGTCILSLIEHLADKVYYSTHVPKSEPIMIQRRGSFIQACEYCDKVYNSLDDLDDHLRTHQKETPFKCFSCAYSSSFEDSFVRHMERHAHEEELRKSTGDY